MRGPCGDKLLATPGVVYHDTYSLSWWHVGRHLALAEAQFTPVLNDPPRRPVTALADGGEGIATDRVGDKQHTAVW